MMTASIDWRARLSARGFMGARQVPRLHGAAVLRSYGEHEAAEAALREALERAPEDENATRAMMALYLETHRTAEAAALRRRLHEKRCRELGLPESEWEAVIAQLETAGTRAPPPERLADKYVVALFDAFAPDFDTKLRGALEYRAPERVLEAVAPLLGERRELDVLDLGCGTGLAGELLRPLARRLTGIDLSAGMLARARERGLYDALQVGEIIGALAESEERHDLIVAVDVLVYIGALETLFARVARRLAPGGLFAFTVEKGHEPGYRLEDSSRYVHHLDYLRACARAAGLHAVVEEEITLRKENWAPVIGYVVVLTCPSM